MDENSVEAQYDITKKTKLKKFYDTYKTYIISGIFTFIILIGSFTFYFDNKEKKKISLSDKYVQARIYIENKENDKGTKLLREIIFANDSTYSLLSLFIILDLNLIKDFQELSILFDHVLKKNKFDQELKELLIFKRSLLSSSFVNESELLELIKPILKAESLWKPHALLLLADYFFSKKEYLKAKEFYSQILNLNNVQKDFKEYASSKLTLIKNEQ